MRRKIAMAEYRSLAQLRYLIRHFLQEGDGTARKAGLEPQQYLMLLTIRGFGKRSRDLEDRRQVHVVLTPKGEKTLERVVEHRISELRTTGKELVKAIGELL